MIIRDLGMSHMLRRPSSRTLSFGMIVCTRASYNVLVVAQSRRYVVHVRPPIPQSRT